MFVSCQSAENWVCGVVLKGSCSSACHMVAKNGCSRLGLIFVAWYGNFGNVLGTVGESRDWATTQG